jgi:pantoate--beta-alanine ligase
VKLLRTIPDVRAHVAGARRDGRSVALVPTMGAFHAGHEALMRAAREACDEVIVSLFVNPAQFDDAADLDGYPRSEADDAAVAAALGVDAMFAPAAREMYPDGFGTSVRVAGLSAVLEGAERGAGHFEGVCTVVCKLLNIVAPDVAFFGQKDAQQVVVVRRMVRDLDIPVRLEIVPTVREDDGLALSSRNRRMDPTDRARAVALRRGLDAAEGAIAAGERDPGRVEAAGRAAMAADGVEPEYFTVVDPDTLERLERIAGRVLVVVAARVGPARLIDNIVVDTQEVATHARWASTTQRSSHVHPTPT